VVIKRSTLSASILEICADIKYYCKSWVIYTYHGLSMISVRGGTVVVIYSVCRYLPLVVQRRAVAPYHGTRRIPQVSNSAARRTLRSWLPSQHPNSGNRIQILEKITVDLISDLIGNVWLVCDAVSHANPTNPTNNKTVRISSHRIAVEQRDQNRNRRIYVGHGVTVGYRFIVHDRRALLTTEYYNWWYIECRIRCGTRGVRSRVQST